MKMAYASKQFTWNSATSGPPQQGSQMSVTINPKQWIQASGQLHQTYTLDWSSFTNIQPLEDYSDSAYSAVWKLGFQDACRKAKIGPKYKQAMKDKTHEGYAYKQGRRDGREYLKTVKALQGK